MKPDSSQDSTHDDAQRRQDVQQSVPPTPTVEKRWEAEENKKNRRPQWFLFVANVLTLLAVLCYACISDQQRQAMLEANNQSKKLMELETRPNIGIEFKESDFVAEPIPTFEIHFVNSGKFPGYANLFWVLSYSSKPANSQAEIQGGYTSINKIVMPGNLGYPQQVALASSNRVDPGKAVEQMKSVGGYLYLWSEARYGLTWDEARSEKYDTMICNLYPIIPKQTSFSLGQADVCPWTNSNRAH